MMKSYNSHVLLEEIPVPPSFVLKALSHLFEESFIHSSTSCNFAFPSRALVLLYLIVH